MSADNWRMCPKCSLNFKKAKENALIEVQKSYGKIPLQSFTEKSKSVNDMPDSPAEETLREDFNIGIGPDGTFFVNYSGHCNVCKFDKEFSHSEKLNLN